MLSQHKLLEHLKAAMNRADGYEGARKQVRDLYFATIDGGATGRIIRFLEDRLL